MKEQERPIVVKKIIRPSDLPWPGDWSLETIGLSQSMIGLWLTCKRMFLFHINGYHNPKKEINTNFGSICHEVNDQVYTAGKYPTTKQIVSGIDTYCQKRIKDGTLVTHQQIEADAAKAEATLIPYFEFYKKDFKNKTFFDAEDLFEIGFGGAKFRGKIDLKYRTKTGKKWLKEHKTKGQINEDGLLTYLPMDFQSKFYLIADKYKTGEMAKGVLYNVIRNSQMKPLKGERISSYKKRLMESIRKNPGHFFKRWETVYTKDEMSIFNFDLSNILHEIKFRHSMHIYPNTFSCLKPWPCQFLKACSENSCRSLVKKNESPEERLFPELKEEANASQKNTTKKKRVAKRKVAKRVKKK